MFFKRFTDQNLAQNAYVIGCQKTGEAIIFDPPRYMTHILEDIKKEGLHITAAAETHIHADFVSGARQLAIEQNIRLYLSNEGDVDWKYRYTDNLNVQFVKEGSEFSIGNIDFTVMHTPGHTPESISFLVTDRGGGASEPMGVITGDFVFVGDIGRPDLLEKVAGISGTATSGAKEMFHSIQRFKTLPDYLLVWPGHGAGSACGKSLGAVPTSTVGYEKQFNWAVKLDDETTFVRALLEDQPEAPTYFATMKMMNKMGPALLENKPIPMIEDVNQLEKLSSEENTLILDTRPAKIAQKELVKGSINIPFNKSFANWAGWLLSTDEKLIVIVTENEKEQILRTLQSVGFDHIHAFLDHQLVAELNHVHYQPLTVQTFNETLHDDDTYLIDVRNDVEWNASHFEQAHHLFLGHLRNTTIPANKKLVIHCQSGARAAIAASILAMRGYEDVSFLQGHFGQVFPITNK